MSSISLTLLVLGIVATAIFIAGFVKGVRQTIANRQSRSKAQAPSATDHWPSVIFAVIASALIIAAVGFAPYAVYAGPLLVILTAAANGVAFFLDHDAS
jgi:fatty acid desaturase